MSLNLKSANQIVIPLSTFGNDIIQYHPHLQNIWKQQIMVYHPYVAQDTVSPLDNHAQRVCNNS